MSYRKKFFRILLISSLAIALPWCVAEMYFLYNKLNDNLERSLNSRAKLIERVLCTLEDGWIKDMRILAASILTSEQNLRKAVDAPVYKKVRISNNIIRDFYYGRADEYTRIYVYDNVGSLLYAFEKGMESTVDEVPVDYRKYNGSLPDKESCSLIGSDKTEILYQCVFAQSNLVVDGLRSTIIYGVYKPVIDTYLARILFAADLSDEASYSYAISSDKYGIVFGNDDNMYEGKRINLKSSILGGVGINVLSDRNIYRAIGMSTYYQIIAIIVISAIVSYVISVFLARYVSKPIEVVAEQIKLVGDKEEFVHNITEGDEIYRLTKAISMMRSEILQQRKKKYLAAMGTLISHIAHDMRSPLSVLKSYVSMHSKSDVHDQIEYNHAAMRSLEKLLHMADDLVDYAKASKIERTRQSIKNLIERNILTEIEGKVKAYGINVSCDVREDIVVNLDSYRIERVLVNLINNSIDAVDRGGKVAVSVKDVGLTDVVILISDNGKGIAVDDIPHVFDSFFTKGKKGGTGLGLSYCKQVVEAHGGTIDVESEIGKGTTFTIRIPNCVVSEAEARAYCNEPQLKIEGRKFLLIDDNADIRLRWRRIVEEGGGTIVGEADSPEKACGDGLDISAADVAIVDYNFEGSEKTGLDVISYLKTRGLREIHMCTGFAHDDTVRRAALSAGANSVIQKG